LPAGIDPSSSAVASSTVTISCGAGRSSTGLHVARCSRRLSICSVTCSSETAGIARETRNPFVRASVMSGRTSR
jgi:hypothetical protein